MFRPLLVFAFATTAVPVIAQEDIDRLVEALRIDETIEIMREEGIEYGVSIADDLFPGHAPGNWEQIVRKIYSGDISAQVEAEVSEALSEVEVAPLVAFFTSDRGREVVALEIEARRALSDEAVEEAALARARALRDEGAPLVEHIDAFIAANDLVEQNVVGAMNANYAFVRGLVSQGGPGEGMSEDQIIADVWAQEPQIRSDAIDWLDGYLMMAYQPLDPEDLEAYVALSETEAGAAMNQAIFDAFDDMYVDISRRLGEQAATFMSGEDI